MEEELEELYVAAKRQIELLKARLEAAELTIKKLTAEKDDALLAVSALVYPRPSTTAGGENALHVARRALLDIHKALAAHDNRVAHAYFIAGNALSALGDQP